MLFVKFCFGFALGPPRAADYGIHTWPSSLKPVHPNPLRHPQNYTYRIGFRRGGRKTGVWGQLHTPGATVMECQLNKKHWELDMKLCTWNSLKAAQQWCAFRGGFSSNLSPTGMEGLQIHSASPCNQPAGYNTAAGKPAPRITSNTPAEPAS